ncbi:MAG: hypothetical protein ACRDSE_20465 [Pseudonocardiaceae bacterium]
MVAYRDEQSAGLVAAQVEPGIEGGDGVGVGSVAAGDADELSALLGVALGAAHVDQETVGLGFDVGEVQVGEFGAAQG